ncbi:uncharacterized protein LOC135154472 [Lytechinus pictus]|uniref:uncharacterized protein LOC135154472 n=1 Tax=Lytechinus pictus TaxID=7653 RepID=UPI0030B9D56A
MNLTFINCYLPCSSSQDDLAEYSLCLSTISTIISSHTNSLIVIAGDFNADISSPSPKKKSAILLNEFICENGLASLLQDVGSKELYTFMSDDGTRTSLIDGFLVPAHSSSLFSKPAILKEHPLNTSDHRPVLVSLHPPHQSGIVFASSSSAPIAEGIQRISISWPSDSAIIRDKYTIPLDSMSAKIFLNLDSLELSPIDIDSIFNILQKNMLTLSLELPHKVNSKKRSGKQEWSHAVSEAYAISLSTWKAWRNAGKPTENNNSLRSKYLTAKKNFRKSLRQSSAKVKLNTRLEIEGARNAPIFYKLVNKRKSSNAPTQNLAYLEYDNTRFTGEQVIEGWQRYFSMLSACSLNPAESPVEDPDINHSPFVASQPSSSCHSKVASLSYPPLHSGTASTPQQVTLTLEDIDNAIALLRPKKAPGSDNITSNHVKHSGPITRRLLLLLIQSCIRIGYIPSSLKDALIIPLHKGKGKPIHDPSSYRGISLTSCMSKLLENVLKPHIEKPLSSVNVPDELQFGFQAGKSCTLTSLTLQLSIELNISAMNPTYLTLLDANKAFDSVSHSGLFSKLQDTPIPSSVQSTLNALYQGASAVSPGKVLSVPSSL